MRVNTHAQGLGGPAGGARGSVSTPAVWTALTEKTANTNVINTSALAAGMPACVCRLCVQWLWHCAASRTPLPNGCLGTVL